MTEFVDYYPGMPAHEWYELETNVLFDLAEEALEEGDFKWNRWLTREAERAEHARIDALDNNEQNYEEA